MTAKPPNLRRIQLCTGLLVRDERLLLVRGRYEDEPEPLWTLPGGRQEVDETIEEAVLREFMEETSLSVTIRELAYIAESFDYANRWHVVNCAFIVEESDRTLTPKPADPKIIEASFIPLAEVSGLLAADVLQIPVAAALGGRLERRYFAFRDSDVKVPFFGRTRLRHG